MAEINVERKRRSVWPWVLGLVILAVLIWALVGLFGDQDEVAQEPISVLTAPATAPAAGADAAAR